MTKNIDKYLAKYAELECQYLSIFPQGKQFNYVLVVPAYKESFAFIQRFFSSPLAQQRVLFICVINQPCSDLNRAPQQHLWQQCCNLGTTLWHHNNLALIEVKNTPSALLIVDRFTTPIASKQGVGLARKIGCDLALTLIKNKYLSSTWLYSSDADVCFPEHYFSSLERLSKQYKAVCFNFSHQSTNKQVEQANQLYEHALRYYVAGLNYAGSPYAFFTIGSILAFDGNAYAMVRGFPKRSAAEDFYLLNKLAKLGQVAFIEHCRLKITARTSDRVPFGTGPAVERIIQLQQENKPYCYYDPHVFEHLKQVLQAAENLWQYRKNLTPWLDKHDDKVKRALLEIGLAQFVRKQANAEQIQFNKQFSVWFDAFKTLKFIHELRANGLVDIPLKQALLNANFTIED